MKKKRRIANFNTFPCCGASISKIELGKNTKEKKGEKCKKEKKNGNLFHSLVVGFPLAKLNQGKI